MNPNFERKGKNMIYTSANGYMFSLLNKKGEIGIRLGKEAYTKFRNDYNATEYRSYGAVMREYVLIPDALLINLELLATYQQQSYDYVMSLPPKPSKKK